MRIFEGKLNILSNPRWLQGFTIVLCVLAAGINYSLFSMQSARAQEIVITEHDPDPGLVRALEPNHSSSHEQTHDNSININIASVDELSAFLPGIGVSKATKIVEWRMLNGPFQTIEQLMLVNGIGTVTFENISHLVRVDDSSAAMQLHQEKRRMQVAAKLKVQYLVMRAEKAAIRP